jgi:hypothetical protein
MVGWKGSNVACHRVAWELTYGAIPNDLHVLHKCDNPPCCNPGHLFLGTHKDNMADMKAKGRARSGGYGENHPFAKLTMAQAEEIRARYAAGGTTYRLLAGEYGLSGASVARIVTGLGYRRT